MCDSLRHTSGSDYCSEIIIPFPNFKNFFIQHIQVKRVSHMSFIQTVVLVKILARRILPLYPTPIAY